SDRSPLVLCWKALVRRRNRGCARLGTTIPAGTSTSPNYGNRRLGSLRRNLFWGDRRLRRRGGKARNWPDIEDSPHWAVASKISFVFSGSLRPLALLLEYPGKRT